MELPRVGNLGLTEAEAREAGPSLMELHACCVRSRRNLLQAAEDCGRERAWPRLGEVIASIPTPIAQAMLAGDAMQALCVFVLRCYRVAVAPLVAYAVFGSSRVLARGAQVGSGDTVDTGRCLSAYA